MGFGSYKTAWYMCHRVRAGLAQEDFRKLMGIVEANETFVGGKAANRHKDKRGGSGRGGMGSGKKPVVGAVERKGKISPLALSMRVTQRYPQILRAWRGI